jgi:hypothetical protein
MASSNLDEFQQRIVRDADEIESMILFPDSRNQRKLAVLVVSDRICHVHRYILIIRQQNVFHELKDFTDPDTRPFLPRLLISAGMEFNAAYQQKRDIIWDTIRRDDPCNFNNPWYIEGKEMPELGKSTIHYVMHIQ